MAGPFDPARFGRRLARIHRLGVKELLTLIRDPVMAGLLVYAFSFGVYTDATAVGSSVNNASVAVVDEDRSALSRRLADALLAPEFQPPELIPASETDAAMDAGRYLFVISIPPDFEADLRAARRPEIQLLVDATAMEQAGLGAGYIEAILREEIMRFATGRELAAAPEAELVTRSAFNPNRSNTKFMAVISLIGHINILTIILTGAALIREREHGTLEHLLAMPITPLDIALAKIWANGAAVLAAATLSLLLVVEGMLKVEFAGSRALFLFGTALYLFSATALGVFLATLARSMAQFALLFFLVILPMQMLSGGETPVESQPDWLQPITFLLPSRHFISFSQAIIFKDAGLSAVWVEFLVVGLMGLALLAVSLALFRRSVAEER
ncbi:MAG: ABC transporter permease [Pseudomonadota bacterium]